VRTELHAAHIRLALCRNEATPPLSIWGIAHTNRRDGQAKGEHRADRLYTWMVATERSCAVCHSLTVPSSLPDRIRLGSLGEIST
jgi:hypothetical protein